MSNQIYYVHKNAGDFIFVKEGEFFKEQGGLREPWGKAWIPVKASSIEDARQIGAKLLNGRICNG